MPLSPAGFNLCVLTRNEGGFDCFLLLSLNKQRVFDNYNLKVLLFSYCLVGWRAAFLLFEWWYRNQIRIFEKLQTFLENTGNMQLGLLQLFFMNEILRAFKNENKTQISP